MALPLIETAAAVVLTVAIKLGVLVTKWKSRAELQRFLKIHPFIRDDRSLAAFKQLARRNMRIALLLLGPLVLDAACIIVVVRAYGLGQYSRLLAVTVGRRVGSTGALAVVRGRGTPGGVHTGGEIVGEKGLSGFLV